MATEKQILANQQNGEASTGPTSQAGKDRSRLNAVKTGITGRIMLLSEADAPIYQLHVDRFFTKYSPANDDEKDLVQTIADTRWRLHMIAPLESGVYATGRDKCMHLVAHIQEPVQREGALNAEIYLAFKKDLANIALQERRLTNKLDKAVEKLEALQKERFDNRQKEVAQAQRSLEACKAHNVEPDFANFGFDFSAAEFETYLVRRHAWVTLTGGKPFSFDKFLIEYRAELSAESQAEAA